MPMGPIELIDTVGLDVAADGGTGQARQEGWPGHLHLGERQAEEAGRSQRLPGTCRSGGPPDPAAAERSSGLPARRRGGRRGPAGCRRDLRHRVRAVPRWSDPAHPCGGC
ncbi:hypothetical protein G6F57_022323 [Rhizopus arrhizus]|nr:hypothetical protein G6F57_022323 [Rhizopus arrhizus]